MSLDQPPPPPPPPPPPDNNRSRERQEVRGSADQTPSSDALDKGAPPADSQDRLEAHFARADGSAAVDTKEPEQPPSSGLHNPPRSTNEAREPAAPSLDTPNPSSNNDALRQSELSGKPDDHVREYSAQTDSGATVERLQPERPERAPEYRAPVEDLGDDKSVGDGARDDGSIPQRQAGVDSDGPSHQPPYTPAGAANPMRVDNTPEEESNEPPQEAEPLAQSVGDADRPDGVKEITPADLRNKTREELYQFAEERGLQPYGKPNADGTPRRFEDPETGVQRLRVELGHVDKVTGKPYDLPSAAAPHVHGYDALGHEISDPATGDPHFPLRV